MPRLGFRYFALALGACPVPFLEPNFPLPLPSHPPFLSIFSFRSKFQELNAPSTAAASSNVPKLCGRRGSSGGAESGRISPREIFQALPPPSGGGGGGRSQMVLQPPASSPSSSLSGSDDEGRGGAGGAAGHHHHHHRRHGHRPRPRRYDSSSDSDSATDSDSDDSTTCVRGYPPLPRPPGTATREERSRFYWELCYGPLPPAAPPPTSRPSPASPAGDRPEGQPPRLPGSWSAGRLPPARSCLSARKSPSSSSRSPFFRGGAPAGATPTLADRFDFHAGGGEGDEGGASTSPFLAPHPAAVSAATPVGLRTPKRGSPGSERPASLLGGRPNVKFGISQAAEFDSARPAFELTPLPTEEAGARFPVEMAQETPEQTVHSRQTKDNSATLAEWEDAFDSFLEEDGEGQQGATMSIALDGDDSFSPDASGFFGDDDLTPSRPLLKPKRPKKKKRRKGHHRTDSAGEGDRRRSSLFFSPGGGSLLGSEDKEMTDVDSPSNLAERPSEFISPPSSSSSRTGTTVSAGRTAALLKAVHSSGGAMEIDEANTPTRQSVMDCNLTSHPDGTSGASATAHQFRLLAQLERYGRVDQPLSSATRSVNVNEVTSEFLLRSHTNTFRPNNHFIESVSKVDPSMVQSLPSNVISAIRDGVLLGGESTDANTSSNLLKMDASATVGDICSLAAQAALVDWRTREISMMHETISAFRAFGEDCDDRSSTLQVLVEKADATLSPSRCKHHSRLYTSFAREIEELIAEIEKECMQLELSLKKRRLSEVQLDVDRQRPIPEISHQVLSALVPIQVENLSENTVGTSFRNGDGSTTKMVWTIQVGDLTDSSDGGPHAPIDGFTISCRTDAPPILSSFNALQNDLLYDFDTDDDDTSLCAFDRYVVQYAKSEPSFTSAFVAVADMLNRVRLLALDVGLLESRGCEMEVMEVAITGDRCTLGLLVKIPFPDGSLMGVHFMYDPLGDTKNNIGRERLVPKGASVMYLHNKGAWADSSLLETLKTTVDMMLKRRRQCNAFVLKEICDKISEIVYSRHSFEIEI